MSPTLLSLPDSIDATLKPSKTEVRPMVESATSRFQSSLVPAQIASVNTAISSNVSSLNQLLESVAVAGVISSIGYPANQETASFKHSAIVAATPFNGGATYLAQKPADALPITSLSDVAIGYPVVSRGEIASPVFNLGQKLVSTEATGVETNFIDLSLVPLGAPVAISQLSDIQNRVTVIDGNATTVRIADFKLAPGLPEMFINTNLATLNLAFPTTSLSKLSSAERIDFKVTGIEISSGITVSGTEDAPTSTTTLLLTGDRSNTQAVSASANSITSPNMAAEINAFAVSFASEFTPLFLAELSSIPAAELQIRLVGTVAITETDILPGTLILGS